MRPGKPFSRNWCSSRPRMRCGRARRPARRSIAARRSFAARVRVIARLPVGISRNGTSLSTRTSCGRPSTRSAMMLRMISSVPPAMRSAGEYSSASSKMPATGMSSPIVGPGHADQVEPVGQDVLQLVRCHHLDDRRFRPRRAAARQCRHAAILGVFQPLRADVEFRQLLLHARRCRSPGRPPAQADWPDGTVRQSPARANRACRAVRSSAWSARRASRRRQGRRASRRECARW